MQLMFANNFEKLSQTLETEYAGSSQYSPYPLLLLFGRCWEKWQADRFPSISFRSCHHSLSTEVRIFKIGRYYTPLMLILETFVRLLFSFLLFSILHIKK